MARLGAAAVCFPFALFLAHAQDLTPPVYPLPRPLIQPNAGNPDLKIKIPHPNAPNENEVSIDSVTQEANGEWRYLRGSARVETTDTLLQADEIDYNSGTGDVILRGNVHYESYISGNKLRCDRGEYNVDTQKGNFYDVTGDSPAKVQARPGLITTTSPFYFRARWVERIEEKYILHAGFITDCKVPKPWWSLSGPKFDVISNDRAIAYNAIFRIRNIPILYFPIYYKALGKSPRHSGFLTPNFGNSSVLGLMFGIGYYWAINRSYDLLYRPEYFAARGLANTLDFRGKPRPGTDFDMQAFGINDRGIMINNVLQKQGGITVNFQGRSDLGDGWEARASIDYLNSFLFRQSFSETYNEAIFSESHSVAFVDKHWSTYGITFAAQRDENFLDIDPAHKIVINTLPVAEFDSADHLFNQRVLPLWFSMTGSAGSFNRTQPGGTGGVYEGTIETPSFVPRIDAAPSVATAFHWDGFSLVPSFTLHETYYADSVNAAGGVHANALLRSAADVDVVLFLPPIARVFKAPKWLGSKLKHVVETRAEFRDVSGVTDFSRILRFDETDLLTDTEELDLSIANRFFLKSADGSVSEVLYWEISQSRYFDPTFGGAVVAGQRNVIASSEAVSGYAFLIGPRNYSPVDSTIRLQKNNFGVEWQADFDPYYGRLTDSGLSVNVRLSQLFVAIGHNEIHSDPVLSPNSNQVSTVVGFGNSQRKGISGAFGIYYDYEQARLQYATAQVTYNTDCCGLSVQFRRFNFGTRDENQFRIAFSVSNVATMGTLRRQDRLF